MQTLARTLLGLALWPALLHAMTIAPVPVMLPATTTVRGMPYFVIDDPGDVSSLTVADDIIATSLLPGTSAGIIDRIQFGPDGQPFPGPASDQLVLSTTGLLDIPQAGDWSFAITAADGFRFRLGAALAVVAEQSAPTRHTEARVVVQVPAPGLYPFELLHFERLGPDLLTLTAAPGAEPADDAWRLVGDVAHDGLPVYGSSGFMVRSVTAVATGQIPDLNTADTLLAGGPGIRSETVAIAPQINFFDTGNPGRFGDDRPFPTDTPGEDDHFAFVAHALIVLPDAGPWTFGLNADDGGRVRIDGATVVTQDGQQTASDALGVFVAPAPGVYNLQLVYYDFTGNSEAELFVARGEPGAFDAGAFRLVGDVARGGIPAFVTTCGDGIVDADEQCDLGASNGDPTTCCTALCALRGADESCGVTDTTCAAVARCSGTTPICPSDAAVACPICQWAVSVPRIDLRATQTGGTFALTGTVAARDGGFDPATDGVRISITDNAGTLVADGILPARPYEPAHSGWRVNKPRTRFAWRDPNAAQNTDDEMLSRALFTTESGASLHFRLSGDVRRLPTGSLHFPLHARITPAAAPEPSSRCGVLSLARSLRRGRRKR